MKTLPNFECYMQHTSKNYGINALTFEDAEGNRFWFSYKTLVAFQPICGPRYCIRNYWGATTGKHLNAIQPDKKLRLDEGAFQQKYNEIFGEVVIDETAA